MPIDVDELLKILPDLIRENDTVKGAIITALSGVVATREDIKDLIREMDKRFDAMQAQMDKRFDAMQAQMDKRFESVHRRLDEQALSGLEYFEDFSREVVRKLLADRGAHPKRLRPIDVQSADGRREEIDVLVHDPPIVGEVTSKVVDIEKIQKFIKKAKLVDEVYGKSYRRLLFTKEIAVTIRDEADCLMTDHDIELVMP